jgi:hypothetical protein
MSSQTPNCLVCQQTSQEIPLIPLIFGSETYYICPSHLPVLIHQPQRLVGLLPGADKLTPHDHSDE